MNPTPKKTSVLEFVLTFAVLFFLTNYALSVFFPKETETVSAVTLKMEYEKVRIGNDPVVLIVNKTDKVLPLPPRCPQPPVNIALIEGEGTAETRTDLMANQSALPCVEVTEVKAGETVKVSLAAWKFALFQKAGAYEASIDLPEGFSPGNSDNVASVPFQITEPGLFTQLFRTFVTKPLLNALVFIASWVPDHNLGLAVIVLTLLVKLVLLLPNQHALEGQRKLQMLQPRMEEIKKKYPNDATRVQEETMKLWKEMKINPLQSCLPTLLQLPILIGLFYVIQDGVALQTSQHLLYPIYQNLPSDFLGLHFLGFDLLEPSIFVMPPLLVILQFIQMKMMMKKPKKKDEIVVTPSAKKSWIPELDQQTIMMYILPFVIGFFAISFPSAVSLYWAVSTLFGIGQQWYVMKEKLSLKA